MDQKTWKKRARWFLKVDVMLSAVVVAAFIASGLMYALRG